MADSTEELTPVLIPFEKATANTITSATAPTTTSATAAAPTAAAAPSASAANAKPKKKHKDWSDPNVDFAGGLSMASNAAGSIAGGLATAGDATRKMMQGVLNPGLMGQGAAEGMLGAVDTMVSPTQESRARHNNMMDAAQLTTNRDELFNQIKTTQNNNQIKAAMEKQAQLIFTNAPFHDRYTSDSLTEDQYTQFMDVYGRDLDALVENWTRQGISPDLIQDVVKAYSSPLKVANKNYQYSHITNPSNQRAQMNAENEAGNAAIDAAAQRDVEQNMYNNFEKIKNDPKFGFASDYLDWAQKNGKVTMSGNGSRISPMDDSIFVDGNGNAMSSPNFDASSARINYDAKSSTLNDYLTYLDSVNDPNGWAAQIRAGGMVHNDQAADRTTQTHSEYINQTSSIDNIEMDPDLKAYAQREGIDFLNDGMQVLNDMGVLPQDNAEFSRFQNTGGLATHDVSNLTTLQNAWSALEKDLYGNTTQDSNGNVQTQVDAVKAKLGNNIPLDDNDRLVLKKYALHRNISARIKGLEALKTATQYSGSVGEKYGLEGRVRDPRGLEGTNYITDTFGDIRATAIPMIEEGLKKLDGELGMTMTALSPNGAFINDQGQIQPNQASSPDVMGHLYSTLFDKGATGLGRRNSNGNIEGAFNDISAGAEKMGQRGPSLDLEGTPELVLPPELQAAAKIIDAVQSGTVSIENAVYRELYTGIPSNAFIGLVDKADVYGIPGFKNFFNKYQTGQFSSKNPDPMMYSSDGIREVHDMMTNIDNTLANSKILTDADRQALKSYKYGFLMNYAQAMKTYLGNTNKTVNYFKRRSVMNKAITQWRRARNEAVKKSGKGKILSRPEAKAEFDRLLNGTGLSESGLAFTSIIANTPAGKNRIGTSINMMSPAQRARFLGGGANAKPKNVEEQIARDAIFAEELFKMIYATL